MSGKKTIMVEGTECYCFPIPVSTKDDPLDDVKWFGECTYHRLFYLNQSDQQRSRELSLAITNMQQALMWLDVHINRRKSGIQSEDSLVAYGVVESNP
jgi:hypothetical protein